MNSPDENVLTSIDSVYSKASMWMGKNWKPTGTVNSLFSVVCECYERKYMLIFIMYVWLQLCV